MLSPTCLSPYYRCQLQTQVITCASEHQLLIGGFHDPSPWRSDASHKPKYFWPTDQKSDVSTTSQGLINLLEQLTELKKTFYLLNHLFVIEVYNSETTIWIWCVRQGMEKECGPSMCPQAHHSPPNPHLFTNLEALQIQFFWVSMKALLLMHDSLNHWPLAIDSTFSPSSLPEVTGVWPKVLTL